MMIGSFGGGDPVRTELWEITELLVLFESCLSEEFLGKRMVFEIPIDPVLHYCHSIIFGVFMSCVYYTMNIFIFFNDFDLKILEYPDTREITVAHTRELNISQLIIAFVVERTYN